VTLRALLDDLAASTGDVVHETVDGATTWMARGRPFATLGPDGTTAEFALDPAVAAAAIRTPDTVPAPRGPGWVAFRPAELDAHAADRAAAWFRSAHRRVLLG
jgi:hypothetical protein